MKGSILYKVAIALATLFFPRIPSRQPEAGCIQLSLIH